MDIYQMEERLVSVIIPVYNVKLFLRECLESVLRQTYEKVEIILVDDGSTDGSGELCDEYAKLKRNVIVIHQEHLGVSVARNRGIEATRGEFVSFVDADDICFEDMIAYLMNGIMNQKNISFVRCAFHRTDRLADVKKVARGEAIFDSKEVIKQLFLGDFMISACGAVFRLSEINSLRFPENREENEDKYFLYCFLMQCTGRIYLSSEVHYINRKWNGSASTLFFAKKGMDRVVLAEEMVADQRKKANADMVELAEYNELVTRLGSLKKAVRAGGGNSKFFWGLREETKKKYAQKKKRFFRHYWAEYMIMVINGQLYQKMICIYDRLKYSINVFERSIFAKKGIEMRKKNSKIEW